MILFTDDDLKHAVEIAKGVGQRYLQLSAIVALAPQEGSEIGQTGSSGSELLQRILAYTVGTQGDMDQRRSMYLVSAVVVGVGIAASLVFYSRPEQQRRAVVDSASRTNAN